MTHQVEIKILGQQFSLVVPAAEEDLFRQALYLLQQKIHIVCENKNIIENDKIITIAALNVIYELLAASQKNDNFDFGGLLRTIDELTQTCKEALQD